MERHLCPQKISVGFQPLKKILQAVLRNLTGFIRRPGVILNERSQECLIPAFLNRELPDRIMHKTPHLSHIQPGRRLFSGDVHPGQKVPVWTLIEIHGIGG